ncbi:MAG: glycosyltransferase family 4 protein [Anaerolineae bacterium]
MRIGIDARLTHYRQAGISQYIVELLRGLARCESDDTFVVLQSIKSRKPILDGPNFLSRRLYTPSHHRLEQLTLPIEIGAQHLDVLHSPDFIPPLRAKCRSVITIHDLVFMLYPHFLTKDAAHYYGQIDQAVRRADAIIAVSQATRSDVIRLLGVDEHKITVIYEAASPVFRPMRSQELTARVNGRFGLRSPFLLFVSTIEPRKNIPNLLRAFRQLLDNYHLDVKLVLAGEKGWLFDEVYALANELNLANDIRFLGRVTTEELLWLYNTAEGLVAPSLYEGFGLTPLEAMACGTPVIVSNVSSLPEVVNDAGLSVDPDDVDALTVAMWRVLDDSELRKKLIEKGLKRATVFSWDKTARETLALYHSLV